MDDKQKVALIQRLTEVWRFDESDEPLRDRTFWLMWKINDIVNGWDQDVEE